MNESCDSFLGLLTILFIGLKLTHYIDWSWWWIFAPIWIPASIAFLIVVFVACVTALHER